MSQIEMIMSAALGFAFAALIALLVGRLVWSYSARIGRRRSERSGSGTMAELQADRDRLKAECAMLTRRFELRLEELKTRLAEQMAEASRHRNRIDQFAADLAARTELLARRELEVGQLREQLPLLENELAMRTQALQQLKAQLRGEGHPGGFEREPGFLPPRAGLANHAPQGPADLPDARAVHATHAEPILHDRVSSRIAELSTLAEQIEAQRQELMREQAELMAMKDDMARTQKRRRRKDDGARTPRKPPVVRKSRSRAGDDAFAEAAADPVPPAEPAPAVEEAQRADKPAAASESTPAPAADPVEPPKDGAADGMRDESRGTPPSETAEAEAETRPDAAGEDGATVITLASRIRALQRGAQG